MNPSSSGPGRVPDGSPLFHRVMAASVFGVICLSVALLRLTDTTIVGLQLWHQFETGTLAYLVGLILIIVGRRWRAPRVLEAGLILIWTRLLAFVLLLPVFAAGRFTLPLQDRALAAIDARMMLTVPMVVAWVGHYPWLKTLLDRSYASLPLLTICGVVLPLVTGRMQAAKELLFSTATAVLITAGIFALVPAVGPWTVYPLAVDPIQSQCARAIEVLRHAGPQILDMNYSGIVSFPSFHVLLAVLSAISVARVSRMLAVPAGIWAALIIVSAVSTGWHYVTDVWGGLLFAPVCLAAARAFTLLERRQKTKKAPLPGPFR